MDKIKVAKRILAMAQRLVSFPMDVVDIERRQRVFVADKLRTKLNVPGRSRPVWSKLLVLVDQSDGEDKNRYHYFAVYKTGDGQFAGGNAWGRIGLKYLRTGGAMMLSRSPDKREVIAACETKVRKKIANDYEVTSYEF